MKKRNSFRRAGRLVVLSGLVLSAALALPMMEGCKKKEVAKAPPPPPPPPPPKEPDPVDLKAMAQTLKASKKVAFSDGATTNQESLAKAIIDLADSIARGDDKKFAGMIGAEDKSLLKSLTSSGEWKDATAKIEGVRVLNIREGGDIVASAGGLTPAFSGSEMLDLLKKQIANMSPEQKKLFVDRYGHEPTDADLDKLIEMGKEAAEAMFDRNKDADPEKMEKLKALAAVNQQDMENALAALKKQAAPAEAAPGGDSDTKFTVVFAVQEPGSAFAQAWVAVPLGEKWVFKASAGQLPAPRTRATEFDTMFGGGGDAPAVTPAEKPQDTPKDETPAPVPAGGKGGGGRTTSGG